MAKPPADQLWQPVPGVEVGHLASPIAGLHGDLPFVLSVGQGLGYFDREEFRAIIKAMKLALLRAEGVVTLAAREDT